MECSLKFQDAAKMVTVIKHNVLVYMRYWFGGLTVRTLDL